MRDRWSSYLACGTFEFSIKLDSGLDGGPLALRKKAHEGMAFWTRWEGYWELPEGGGKLMDDLKQSGLVIFKVLPSSFMKRKLDIDLFT